MDSLLNSHTLVAAVDCFLVGRGTTAMSDSGNANDRSRGFLDLVPLLACILIACLISMFSSTSHLALFFPGKEVQQHAKVISTGSDHPLPQLLGILLVGPADIYTIKDWLHRHVRIFDKLVVIDGSRKTFVKDEIQKYSNTFVLPEDTLNLTSITDQTLRKPAMTVLGDPVGSWIMVCHADEFWTIDPRRLVYENSRKNTKLNLLRVRVLTASPLESKYSKEIRKLDANKEYLAHGFHIMDVSNLAHNKNGTSDLARRSYFENRFFKWETGMAWGDRNHLVIPEHNPWNYSRHVFRNAFYVHFKLHDFSPSALEGDGSVFANSKLNTGLHNNSDEGWMGSFLDKTFPDKLELFPPEPIETALHYSCTIEGDPHWPCELPWTTEASFQ